MHLELWTFKSLGVSFNGQSISKCCTHRERMWVSLSSQPWVICWAVQPGASHKHRNTKMIWPSQPSWVCSPKQHPRHLFSSQKLTPIVQPHRSSGAKWTKWWLGLEIWSLENIPFPQSCFFALESLGSIFLEIYSLGNLETFRKYSL